VAKDRLRPQRANRRLAHEGPVRTDHGATPVSGRDKAPREPERPTERPRDHGQAQQPRPLRQLRELPAQRPADGVRERLVVREEQRGLDRVEPMNVACRADRPRPHTAEVGKAGREVGQKRLVLVDVPGANPTADDPDSNGSARQPPDLVRKAHDRRLVGVARILVREPKRERTGSPSRAQPPAGADRRCDQCPRSTPASQPVDPSPNANARAADKTPQTAHHPRAYP
jgi:hypothetical protein